MASLKSKRCYFYNIDLQGRIFLEETRPKNIATCLKDTRFIDFFFRRLRSVSSTELLFMNDHGIPLDDYPYISICGGEMNFVRPASAPIVFHSLVEGNLIYGGTLQQPLQYDKLAISKESGWLYHEITEPEPSNKFGAYPSYGLVRSTVAVTLSDMIVPSETDEPLGECSGLEIHNNGAKIALQWLPAQNEPGKWSLPT